MVPYQHPLIRICSLADNPKDCVVEVLELHSLDGFDVQGANMKMYRSRRVLAWCYGG